MLPTLYPDVSALVNTLLSGVQKILGEHLVGMYLEGSLAAGDFDLDSDIDFIAVTEHEITGEKFAALKAMHIEITASESRWAKELEGSYIPRAALRRYDPANARHPNIQRGSKCTLQVQQHDDSGVIHRHILREHGITLVGPEPATLVDPISPDDLQCAVKVILQDWSRALLSTSTPFNSRGYQSFVVLSMCRVLYTLEHGTVVSKRAAARWMQEREPRWAGLIDRAWVSRANPSGMAVPRDVEETLALVRWCVSQMI